jgi:hypothetical protein
MTAFHLRDHIGSGAGQLRVGPGLDNARAKHEGLYFLLVEHQRRQVKTGLEHIADARLPSIGTPLTIKSWMSR